MRPFQEQRLRRLPQRRGGGRQLVPGYRAEFKQVFGKDAITIDEVTSALAAFEETLVTPNSRFDQWL
ncbi:hypothetical protein CTI14_55155, partial [Methylobacterium radiotolerans]